MSSDYLPGLSTDVTRAVVVECYSGLLDLTDEGVGVKFYYPELVAKLAEEDVGFKSSLYSSLGEVEAAAFLNDPSIRQAEELTIEEAANVRYLTRELLAGCADELIEVARAVYAATGRVCDPSNVSMRLMLSSLFTDKPSDKNKEIYRKLTATPGADGLEGIPREVVDGFMDPPRSKDYVESLGGYDDVHFKKGRVNFKKTPPEVLSRLLAEASLLDVMSTVTRSKSLRERFVGSPKEIKEWWSLISKSWKKYTLVTGLPNAAATVSEHILHHPVTVGTVELVAVGAAAAIVTMVYDVYRLHRTTDIRLDQEKKGQHLLEIYASDPTRVTTATGLRISPGEKPKSYLTQQSAPDAKKPKPIIRTPSSRIQPNSRDVHP